MRRSVIGSGKFRGISKSRYSRTSRSRSSLPASTCCITATAVNSFAIEPGRKSVSSADHRFLILGIGEAIALRQHHLATPDDRDDSARDVAILKLRIDQPVEERLEIRAC